MKRTLIVAVVLLVALSACTGGLFQRKETFRLPEVNIGTQGVALTFGPNIPLREVYEESPFNLLVTMSNIGTSDVEQGVYSLSFERQYLYLPQQQALGRFAARGKSVFNPQGEERQVNFLFSAKQLGPNMERYPATITFNACYPYTTTAPLVVCIDTDVTGKRPDKVCMPQPQAFSAGQGAPVVVASVEPRMLPQFDLNRVIPEFVLTLRNQGMGEVVAPQLYREACSGQALGEDGWNVVEVHAELAGTPLTCTPVSIKLKQQGETRVVCRLNEGIDARLGAYTELLTVLVDYGYLSSVSTPITILKAR